jgi:thioesterase domain-containing protein/acyl carrier protein
VEPGEIETLLRRQEAIKDAVVLADGAGETIRLIAYVIPKTGRRVNQVETRGELTRHLPAALIPARVIVLDAFPTTPSGKVNRKALAALNTAGDGSTPADAAPMGETEQRLARLWAEELKLSAVGVHDDFFALGGHSLLGVRLFARIEEEFGTRLPLSLLFSAPTIAQLARRMDEGVVTARSPIITPIQPAGTKPPFFCVHGFGGGVLGYAELARLLGPDQPFYGLQALGYDGTVEPDTDIETMAAHYVEALRSVQPRGPYRIGGYCYGGVVAYEMARQLEAIGEEAALVALFEGFAPSRFHARTPRMHPRRLLTIWRSLPYWARDYASMDKGWLIEFARARLERQHGRSRAMSGEATQRELAVVAGSDLTGVPAHQQQLMWLHLQALRNYSPGPYHGRVTLFRSDWQSVSRALFGALDPEYGWGALAAGGVEVRLIAGSHRNIHMAPHVGSLAEQLRSALDAVADM